MAETNSAAKEAAMPLPKLVLKGVDMSQDEVHFATQVARKCFVALLKSEVRYWQDVAQMLKKEFEKKYEGMWHVIVGCRLPVFYSRYEHEDALLVYFELYLAQLLSASSNKKRVSLDEGEATMHDYRVFPELSAFYAAMKEGGYRACARASHEILQEV